MGPNRFYSQNFSLLIVKFKKLGFSAPLKASIWEGILECSSFRRTPKFSQKNCLINNFRHCEFQLSMFSSLKVLFWEVYFEEFFPRKTPKFGQKNCLTNNFFHCEFQLSTSSRSKGPFPGPLFWGSPMT